MDRLKKDAKIVIKKTDKDVALVVLKTENYIKMGNNHLRDTDIWDIGNPRRSSTRSNQRK